jgi:hypothetical protein
MKFTEWLEIFGVIIAIAIITLLASPWVALFCRFYYNWVAKLVT